MAGHPLLVGTRVRHSSQQWARAATATVREVKGPYNDSPWEYRVTCGEDFSRRLSPDNPETRETWWPSLATRTTP